MKVILAKSAGFCKGVRRAIKLARKIAEDTRQKIPDAIIFTDGPLIHNAKMLEVLRSEGILEASEENLPENATLIIRAHGITPERYAFLKRKTRQIIDCTCPDVARSQKIVSEYSQKGYAIVVYGDPNHAEVKALLGCAKSHGFVVSSTEDVDGLPAMNSYKGICILAQSTQIPSEYEKITQRLNDRYQNVFILDTICRSTKFRQKELVEIARKVDAMVIVGDPRSANTKNLYKIAQKLKPTFLVQDADELDEEKFRRFNVVGLSAGASTPDFIIMRVKEKLESFSPS